MQLVDRMIRTVQERILFSRGQSIILSLSGGCDSTAMVHLIRSVEAKWQLSLHAVHVNHGLRGEESEEDERFVCALCRSLRIHVAVRSAPPPPNQRRGESVQVAARRTRYALLEEERERLGFDLVATGHNRDDRAETLLLNLFRGSGVRGMGGIPYKRGTIVRPLLDIPRIEIEEYLRSRNISFRTDPSNRKTDYDRNKVRHQIIPHIEEVMGRPITECLHRTADVASDLDAFVEAVASDWLKGKARTDEKQHRESAPARELALLPRAVAREVIRLLVRRVAGSLDGLRHEHVERILDIVRETEDKKVTLPGNVVARREGVDLVLAEEAGDAPPFEKPLPVPGSVELPGGVTMKSQILSRPAVSIDTTPRLSEVAHLDAGRVEPPLRVRSRLPGDRFHPLGAPGARKLQDLLVDRKIPRWHRDSIPILVDGRGIIWVAGVEIAERVKVTSGTAKILEVAIC